MDWVITLLGEPGKESVNEALIKALAHRVFARKAEWHKPGEACTLYCQTEPNPPREFLNNAQVDFIIRRTDAQPIKLMISDMDSTMITVECIDELADFVGKREHVAAITERAMKGELDFEAALTERVALLKGLPEAALEQCYRERVQMSPGAKELVSHLKKHGAHCVLVSGGFTFFTSRVAAELGFDEHHGNTLEVENGALTGRVIPPILGKEAKLQTLKANMQRLNISAEQVLAIGDGANDLPMLKAAGFPLAYRAKPLVEAAVKHRLRYADLGELQYVIA